MTHKPPYDQSVSPFGVKIPFAEHLGITMTECTKERVVVAFDRTPETSNSLGSVHGGVIMTLLDLVMTCAVRAHYGVAGGVITIDMSCNFIRPGSARVLAEARVLNGGKSMAFCEAEARDPEGKLLAKSIGTFRLVEK